MNSLPLTSEALFRYLEMEEDLPTPTPAPRKERDASDLGPQSHGSRCAGAQGSQAEWTEIRT